MRCLVRYMYFLLFMSGLVCCKRRFDPHDPIPLLVHVDTTNAYNTFLRVKGLNEIWTDSIYRGLLVYLYDSDQYELLYQHTLYYKKLSGQKIEKKALIAKSEGVAYNFFSKYDSSEYFLDEAIVLYTKLHRPEDIADCYYNQAINYFHQGDYAQTFSCEYKALDIYEQLNDSAEIYRVKVEIGDDYLHIGEYDKALPILTSCQRYFHIHKDEPKESYAESLVGQCYFGKHDWYKALEYVKISLSIRVKNNDQIGISGSLNNMSAIYLQLRQWEKADSGFNVSLAILRQLHDERQIPIVKENIANCLLQMGHIKEAEQMLLTSIDTAVQKKQEVILVHAYMLLYNINKEKKDYKAALCYYELYKKNYDTVFNRDKAQIIEDLNVKYDTKQKEIRIVQLNADKKIETLKKNLYLITLLFTAIGAIAVFLFLLERNRRGKRHLELAQKELEDNALELSRFTNSILSKNKIIEELESRSQYKAQQHIQEDDNKEQLGQLYQLKILTEDDWHQFKILFDKVYPGFISMLRERYPDLAPAEERQCLLIKLKISNKESAAMLGISSEGIKKNRYRLKKRFDLSEQDDLDGFVLRLK